MEEDKPTVSEICLLPFLGCRLDGESFQYALITLDSKGAEIGVLEWFDVLSKLQVNEEIDLFVPLLLSIEFVYRGNVRGKIVSERYSQEYRGYLYTIEFPEPLIGFSADKQSFQEYSRDLPILNSPIELILYLIKDSIFKKQGIAIYLKHLIPYFSRIVDRSKEDFSSLKELLFLDIQNHLETSEIKLKELYEKLQKEMKTADTIVQLIDLDSLRPLIESELNLPLLNITFTGSLQSSDESFQMYLKAIRILEKELYSNYNLIVMVYLKNI